MAFDPTLPVNGSDIYASELRAQFNGLKALVDAQDVSIANLNATVSTQAAQIAALAVALANTAQNPSVSQMGLGLSDPPSQVQLQAIYDTLNTLINQLVRV